jgi:hypothetical protein
MVSRILHDTYTTQCRDAWAPHTQTQMHVWSVCLSVCLSSFGHTRAFWPRIWPPLFVNMATKRPRHSAATERSPKRRWNEAGCEALPGLRRFANFSAACRHYGFPGSHQVGSYGPKGEGIVRTYSNAAPGKDLVMDGGDKFLYRLKDSTVRAQFEVNASHGRPVKVFRKVAAGVVELGSFDVDGFEPAGPDDAPEWGKTFVRFLRREEEKQNAEEPEPPLVSCILKKGSAQ